MFRKLGMFDRSLGMFQPPGSIPFYPGQLFAAGEQGVWYDPSDFSTLFQDSAGTTPVTAIEQPVGRILDKSGRGNHASQSTTTSRPILRQEAGGQYYLAFDGTDDWLSTANINFSATDKMSVFAGVRKLSDASRRIVCELSADLNTNNGSFNANAPSATPATNKYAFATKGTATASLDITNAAYTAPITNVFTSLADISGDSAIVRLNAVQAGLSTDNQGTGNYGNYPIYIGARYGTTTRSLFFFGRIYSLIIRGALTSGTQLTNTETWVAAKTGVTL